MGCTVQASTQQSDDLKLQVADINKALEHAVCVYIYMCTYTCVYIYMCVHIHVYIYMCTYTCVHIHVYICMYTAASTHHCNVFGYAT
jgi:hypothetical protein